MRYEAARAIALALPEATEEPHFELVSWRIRGKIFTTAPTDHLHLHVFVEEDEVRASVADDPDTFEELWWGKRLSGVRVRLTTADPVRVAELLEEAWRRKAPKRVVAAFDAEGGQTGQPR